MGKVRNRSRRTLWVPELHKAVEPDEVVQVPDSRLAGYLCNPKTWQDETVASKPVEDVTTKSKPSKSKSKEQE